VGKDGEKRTKKHTCSWVQDKRHIIIVISFAIDGSSLPL
jgi:hypothetical protein